MKQTALEWFIYQITENHMLAIDAISLAKEMEKQQIMDAHNNGYADGYRDNGNSPIDYFTETFKK